MIGFFLTGYLVSAVTVAGIGAATTSIKEASQVSMIVTLPTIVPIWFLPMLLGNPDGGISRLLSFIPFTAPVTMMIRLGASDVPPWEVVGSLAVLLLTGVALLWISARVFRAGNADVWPTDEPPWRVRCSARGGLAPYSGERPEIRRCLDGLRPHGQIPARGELVEPLALARQSPPCVPSW